MTAVSESLTLALLAFATLRTPGRIADALARQGRDGLRDLISSLDETSLIEIEIKARELDARGIDAVLFGDDDFPVKLVNKGRPLMPILFYKGNKDLLYRDGIGMCGSRHATPQGLQAADRCGTAVSERQLSIVSGYAKGVDSVTHLAALRSGGATVIVLAEGFDHFRVKREFAADMDMDRTLVVSQFAPGQTWQAHAAMARNAVIFGLSNALVVVEAGDRGGTLAAGHGAMKLGRPVLVLDFADRTPAGNLRLLEAGATRVSTPKELHDALDRVAEFREPPAPEVPLF